MKLMVGKYPMYLMFIYMGKPPNVKMREFDRKLPAYKTFTPQLEYRIFV